MCACVRYQGSRKPDLIGVAIITIPTNHTHSFVQVMSCINRKDNTAFFYQMNQTII